jgi:hypothetical protein
MSLETRDKVGYDKLVAYDKARDGKFADVVSQYVGLRLNSDPATSPEMIKAVITFGIPLEKQVEWIAFLMYSMRTDVITHAGTRDLIRELFNDAYRAAEDKKKMNAEELGLVQDKRAKVQAGLRAAKRSPGGAVAFMSGGAAIGGAVAGPVGALIGFGGGALVGALAFLN